VYFAYLGIVIVVNGTPAHQCTAQNSQSEKLENGMPKTYLPSTQRDVRTVLVQEPKKGGKKKKTQGLQRARDLMYILCISFSSWLCDNCGLSLLGRDGL